MDVKSRFLCIKLAEHEVNQAIEKVLENKQKNSVDNPFAMTWLGFLSVI